ncbi:MAG: hypothetical protein IT536_14290 [Hyphomicrobiales bacterium]|nr:hypothetical protein [Hyphomicrobiales bacterium]
MLRAIKSLFRGLATALAVVAALAFVFESALGADHNRPASASTSASGHHHAYDHGQSAGSAHHHQQHAVGPAAAGGDAQAVPDADSLPAADACYCYSCSAVVLPILSYVAAPLTALQAMTLFGAGRHDGVVPAGLRRPPRAIAIA